MPEVLKGGLHTKNYNLIKYPLATNDIGNLLEGKGLLLVAGAGHKVQWGLLLPAFSHVHIKRLAPRLWSKGVEMTQKVAEMVGASRSGASGVGEKGIVVEVEKWCSLATPDIMYFSGFSYEFLRLESASLSGGSSIEKSPAPSQQTQIIGKKCPSTRISEIYGLLSVRI